MTSVETTSNTATNTAATTPAAAAPAAPKAPSKKSLAIAIFAEKMAERKHGLFADNKSFRAAVLRKIESDLGVSTASAATMYNAAKAEAEAADATVGLGRDPKKVKVKVEGAKRGRPSGSKNKDKPAVVVTTEAAPTDAAPAATEAVAA